MKATLCNEGENGEQVLLQPETPRELEIIDKVWLSNHRNFNLRFSRNKKCLVIRLKSYYPCPTCGTNIGKVREDWNK